MKRIATLLLAVTFSFTAFAQEEKSNDEKNSTAEKSGGFKVEHLFTGGNLNIGFFNGVTVLGATPQLGYSVANWLDAGIVFGFTYTSQSISSTDKIRQTTPGPGAFVRLFPIDFLFASIQYEHNFIRQKKFNFGGSQVYKVNAGSLLAGIGYTSGRGSRNAPYYYFSISVDLLNNQYSPYRTVSNEVYPVVNAGFNIPLFQGTGRRR